jgi:hypothetical protein
MLLQVQPTEMRVRSIQDDEFTNERIALERHPLRKNIVIIIVLLVIMNEA